MPLSKRTHRTNDAATTGGKNESNPGFWPGRRRRRDHVRQRPSSAGAGQLSEPADPHHRALSPGGIVDIIARAVTEQVGRDWKQPVVVEARPGANSNIGTAAVARSDPDGYTWLVTGPAVLVNPTLYKDAGWDTMQSFKCVGLAVWNQSVAVVNPAMPAKTLAEFVALARGKPGQLNFGNPGTGSSIDLTAQKLFQAANIKLTNVGYKGQPQALVDLMTNLMHFEIVSLALALPHIKDGTIKPLAVFTENRVADLPDVPTIAEAGYPEASYVPWYGIYVPSATPDALVEKIHDGDQQGAAKSRRAAPAGGRRHPGQADATE